MTDEMIVEAIRAVKLEASRGPEFAGATAPVANPEPARFVEPYHLDLELAAVDRGLRQRPDVERLLRSRDRDLCFHLSISLLSFGLRQFFVLPLIKHCSY